MENVIGTNLKLLRENSGYTQERVAGFLGLNRSAYANYEAGERAVPLTVAESAAALYGVDLAVLFEPDPDMVMSQLICAFRAEGLDEEDMKQVLYADQFQFDERTSAFHCCTRTLLSFL